jgi:hypothetical protein
MNQTTLIAKVRKIIFDRDVVVGRTTWEKPNLDKNFLNSIRRKAASCIIQKVPATHSTLHWCKRGKGLKSKLDSGSFPRKQVPASVAF